jgi:MoaA/NifB/PqqE/SkfB family radical SAM enzyme
MRIPRMDLNRVALETVIPLSVPFSIYIDPSTACNFQCEFCPTGDHKLIKTVPGRKAELMDFGLYRKIINDLRQFERPVKVIHLYIDGEPLLNPRFPDMISYAKQSGCVEKVDFTTNASQLSPELNRRIIEAGADQINISIYGMNVKQYLNFTKYDVDFEALVANIRHLYEHRRNCKVIIKINGDLISKDDEEKFLETFEPIADGVNIEHVMSCWPEFNLEQKGLQANTDFGIYGQPIKEVSVCPYVFFSFAIHPDGMASACFLDWSRKLIVGDVKTESVRDIWNGMDLRYHRLLMLLDERKSHPVCGNCDQLRRGLPDDIDSHREKLLERFVMM